jgi:hypothetical protein
MVLPQNERSESVHVDSTLKAETNAANEIKNTEVDFNLVRSSPGSELNLKNLAVDP